LKKHCNLWNAKDVEAFIAIKKGNDYKNLLLKAYHHSTRYQEIPYSVKLYQVTRKRPNVPLEKSIDQLASYLSHTESRAFLQLTKETGLRGEVIMRLTADGFDLEHRILTVNDPAKNTPCGQFKLSA